ncbi:hypothetical protein DFH94DRAFT_797347, partial [Russula ochroleuca]
MGDFLQEYEFLADDDGLTDQEKVETILRYTPLAIRRVWRTLDGFRTGDWEIFRATLETMYPDRASRYSRKALKDFVNTSAKSRMRTEDDVITYYRHFLQISLLLHKSQRIS